MSGRLNLVLPEVLSNPYPHFARLRRDSPVCQVEPGGLWAVTRYADVMHVLKNPQVFSSAGLQRSMLPSWLEHNPIAHSLLVMDAPQHGRARALVSRAFSTSMLTRLEPALRTTAEQLVSALVAQRTVDFLPALALPLPAAAVGLLLGLDPSLFPRFKRWSDDLGAVSATSESDHEGQKRIRHTIQEMEHYLREVVAERRRAPREDLVSALLQARVDGEALNDAELMAFLFLLLVAGFETTVNLLGNGAVLLADQPGLLERLRAEPALVPAFIEEVLRYESPAQSTFRLTLEEVELGGVRLPQHSVLILLLGSASRDEAYVPEPERFILERPQRGNLAFGHGAHFCLGAALTRMEARVALEALLPRIQRLSRGPEPLQWTPSIQLRGLSRLPVEVTPA
ncbi:cytochrome P450 [Archangium gephyra]|uniref:Cytochrome P450 n=1 Tax=Archangium gephyra TaxID=48 RepID=A0ABX9JY71_9BACT|nr:cytochrome P450 [Archangium gephyra]REG29401.1 cytochrome P450 [Archangium gephyra]